MIHHALWVAEQQFAWSKRNFTPTRDNEGEWHIATAPFYLATFGVVSSAPYAAVITTADSLAWHAATDVQERVIMKGMGVRIGKRKAARWAATKLATRAIPYVGWALLAYDLWHVGKWVKEKTS